MDSKVSNAGTTLFLPAPAILSWMALLVPPRELQQKLLQLAVCSSSRPSWPSSQPWSSFEVSNRQFCFCQTFWLRNVANCGLHRNMDTDLVAVLVGRNAAHRPTRQVALLRAFGQSFGWSRRVQWSINIYQDGSSDNLYFFTGLKSSCVCHGNTCMCMWTVMIFGWNNISIVAFQRL